MTTRNPTIRSFLKGKHSKKTVFDFVYKKVLEQGKASLASDGSGRCAYRSEDGCKCAAGHLVSDRDMKAAAVIDHSINIGGIYSLTAALGILTSTHDPKITFIRDLQRAHDEAAYTDNDGRASDAVFIKQYKKNMANVAKLHDL